MWLRVAIDGHVKDLNFYFDGRDELVLPHCIFMSQSLITLTLHWCTLQHQPHVHMGTLRELSLVNVQGSGEAFNQLILGCPYLQELNINVLYEPDVDVNITSPSVRKLSLYTDSQGYSIALSCPNLKILDIDAMVELIDVSSLQVVNIKDLIYDDLPEVEAFLRQIQNVEVVTLSAHAFEKLCWRRKIKYQLTSWKRLVLWPSWNEYNCVQLILLLVGISAKLEELTIYNGPHLMVEQLVMLLI
ncbi:hypothetical protein RND81_01G171600 [Saponaria officinalis]|uniref:F-box/LRR-repeat protein 15/At3g58940/PEG3-like LRR domain-containing protein n=1 Tax=Saponaria officinalis TaxID=3572 RepID=A0AAW1N8B6_SAPOF